MVVSEWNHAFRLGKAKGVQVVAVFAEVVASMTVVAVLTCWAIPDRVTGLELPTKVAAVGEWGGFGQTTGLGVVIMV